MPLGLRPRAGHAEQRDVGGLGQRGIPACRLAKHFGCGGGIENVISDLERQADFAAKRTECVNGCAIGTRRETTEEDCSTDQRTGFMDVVRSWSMGQL